MAIINFTMLIIFLILFIIMLIKITKVKHNSENIEVFKIITYISMFIIVNFTIPSLIFMLDLSEKLYIASEIKSDDFLNPSFFIFVYNVFELIFLFSIYKYFLHSKDDDFHVSMNWGVVILLSFIIKMLFFSLLLINIL